MPSRNATFVNQGVLLSCPCILLHQPMSDGATASEATWALWIADRWETDRQAGGDEGEWTGDAGTPIRT